MSIWTTITGWFAPSVGIPNLELVSSTGVYRGGQPTCQADWDYLKKLGVTNVVKLNMDSEGSDAGAGMPVVEFEIDTADQFLGTHLEVDLIGAVNAIHPHSFVHCEHGEDRTGLVIALWRVRVQGWSKAAAEQEMLAHGFHKALLGLWRFWEDYQP